jgi:hypothetical protein
MTETVTDPFAAFRASLPPYLRGRVYDTQRGRTLIARAIHQHGWTVEQLAAECSRDLHGIRNAGGVVTFRLEHCAENPPPDRHAPRTLPFCSDECRERRGFIEDDTGRPIGKCPCRTSEAPA